MTDQSNGSDDKRYWLDQPKNVTIIVWVVVAICVLLFFADGFYHKHVYFEIENLFGFYGLFGFTVYVCLVLTAKWLRNFLMRSEDYYDRDD
ncbi:MAG: hypothetical protein ACR2Q4_09895 [Geminicoccaceae bacterium]